ncbi:orotidine-5'-phosphate decarboxylase [Bacillus taeanensis]|uniref:Orotidine 5'-phosphate decarboxylase n=1 Tax=Bacillus taeanensis TaxID=273032 RepID=A0A366XT55_9BACI|nr:orotidine-5'-phosphate decarboxylase [Bacillus taeanensis]RBW67343.1 orotidine-5'-phosphate decarboxylase [Bacillus taeanensis]
MSKPIILALDFPTTKDVEAFLKPFSNESLYVKVGMELYYQTGPALIDLLKRDGHKVFLDLKLHDIPNTVKRAMKGLASLEVDLVNVHAAGGCAMMEAAVEGLESGTAAGKKRPDCIAVTQLTSTSQEIMQQEILIHHEMKEVVKRYAKFARQSGLEGVVCSALEVPAIKEYCGQDTMTVTPGIRIAGDLAGDQKRVTTPAKARKLGSDAIVVGRSITSAKDPVQAYQQVQQEWSV